MKHYSHKSYTLPLLCSLAVLFWQTTQAAVTWWDQAGNWGGYSTYTNGSLSGTWESTKWSPYDKGTNTPIVWPEGNAVGFAVGAGATNSGTSGSTTAFTVTLNSDHSIAGIFDGALNPNSCIVTLSGSGKITLVSGQDAFDLLNSSDSSLGQVIINNRLTGPGQITAEGTGQIFLNGANDFTGGITYGYSGASFSGIINFNSVASFGTGGIWISNTALNTAALVANTTSAVTVTNAFDFSKSNTNAPPFNIVGNTAGATFSGPWTLGAKNVSLGSGGAANNLVTLSGVLSGSGSLTKFNPGILALSGANTFSGPVTNTAGILTVNSIADSGSSALGLGTLLTFKGGTFQYTGTAAATTARALWQTAASTIDLPNGNLTFTGQFKNSSSGNSFTKTGTGTLTLGGTTDNSSLGMTVSGGTLVLNKTSTSSVHALGATTTINNGGTLQLSGSGGDQIFSGVNVTVNSGGVFDANGQNEGMTSLTLNGTGFSSGGALINSASATTSTITGTAANGFPLGSAASIGGAGNLTLVGVVSGAFPLTKVGAGTLKLNSADTYSGSTTVSGGTLEVATSIASTTVTVASGATLKLDSATALPSAAALVLNAGSPSVNLNFSGGQQVASLSFDGGTTQVANGTWGAAGSGAANTDSRLSGTGILNVGIAQPSSVAVTSSGTPSTYGGSITLTATVTGSGATPTGSVTFRDGATALATVPLDGSGVATLTTSTFNAATHSVTALYFGDANYGAALSSVFSQVVSKAALTVSANDQTKTYGQTVTFGAGSTLFTSSGLQNGETIGTVTLAVSGSGGAATATVAGSPYTITPSAATGGTFSAANYTISYTTGTLTVNPAALTVTTAGLLTYGNDPSNTVYTPSYTGFQNSDTASVVTGSATYSTDATATNYIGANYIAHVVDLGTLSAANYTFAAGPDGVTTITNRPLWVTNALASDKVYDATTAAAVDLSAAGLTNLANGDDASVSLVTSNAVGVFANKNVGAAKPVTITGLALAGDLGTNYVLIQPATATASITAAPLSVSATGVDKTYDGTMAATVTLSTTPLGTDSVTPTYSSAAFASKNVATGIAVSVSGIALTGPDAGNYTPNTTASTTANITARTLTVTATGVNKVYDGTPAASVTLADNKVAGDDVSDNYTAASFADKVVGAGKAVSVSGIAIGGADAGNYLLANSTASTTASISVRTLTVTATGVDKVYDGNAAASVTLSDDKVAGDVVTDAYTSASFADKAVAPGKAVSVSSIGISGADASNYTLASTTASTTASITARTLTVTATAANKAYDGTTTASVTLADDKLTGDAVTDSYASATFADKNIGTGKTVTVSGISISGTDAANYALGNTTATATADITGVSLTVAGAEAADKVYDGTTNATLILSNAVLVGVAGTDDVTLITTNALGAFADKNVGTNKLVTLSGLGLAGADAANYGLIQPTTNASITPAALTVSATASNKVYDGTTAAAVTLSDNKVAGDDVSESYTAAAFADKNAATGKSVTVSGISLSGADIGNYTLASTTANATADITPASLTVSATGVNKVYDGTTAATVTLADNKLAGDDVTDSYASAVFADKNVATGIAVSVSGLSLSGADAGNYTLASTTASTTADITARTLTVTATGVNKVYDGTTAATVTLSDDKVVGDDVSESYTAATFADANVGTGKAVSVSGISLSGTAAANYSLASTTASTTADITAVGSMTAMTSSLNPSTEGSNVTFTATVSSAAGTPTGDVVFLVNGVPLSTNTLAGGVASVSTAALAVGTNTIAAQYATQANWLLSSATLEQVVQSAIVYSQTNAVLGITANGNGTYTLSLLGTAGASYYVVSGADLTAPTAAWSALSYSTNTAPSPSGQWSVVVSNAAPAFYRSVAINPAP